MDKAPSILIVDDEPHIVHVLSVKLVQAGFRVSCAPDGSRALQSLHQDAPDLIILADDVTGINGRRLTDTVSQSPAAANVPVLLLTTHRRVIAIGDAYTDNIRAVIGKPFRPSDVIRQVNTILNIKAPLEVA